MKSWRTGGVEVKVEERYRLAARFRRRYLTASRAQRTRDVRESLASCRSSVSRTLRWVGVAFGTAPALH